MKKNRFVSPEIEIVNVSNIDVMTSSTPGTARTIYNDVQWFSEPKVELGV